MGIISIQNGIISSSADYGLYHGTSPIATITSTGQQLTGSVSLQSGNTNDFFLLKSGSFDSLTINGQGVLTLGGFVWLIVALIWREPALIVTNIVLVTVATIGLIYANWLT